MIQLGSMLKVCDKTGVVLVQCIKVLGPSKKRIASLGDVVLISVKKFNLNRMRSNRKRKNRYVKGSIYRALIVRNKVNYQRTAGVFVKFDENTVVLVNKKTVPVSNRVFGPILKEFCMKWPSLGCITRFII